MPLIHLYIRDCVTSTFCPEAAVALYFLVNALSLYMTHGSI